MLSRSYQFTVSLNNTHTHTQVIKQDVLMREIRTIYCRYSLAGTHKHHTKFIRIFISLRKVRVTCLSETVPRFNVFNVQWLKYLLPCVTLNTPQWFQTLYVKVKVKQWSGPEGSRKLRFPDFMSTAQDGGKVVSLTHRPPLPPGNAPGTHFC